MINEFKETLNKIEQESNIMVKAMKLYKLSNKIRDYADKLVEEKRKNEVIISDIRANY